MTLTAVSSALSAAALAITIAGAPAFAQTMYKHVDSQGRVTYSNEPIPGGKRMALDPLTTIQAPKVTPSAVPSPDPRAESLARELVTEREKLALARHALEVEKQKPEVVQASNGGGMQANGRYEDKIRTLTEQVETQERKVDALERELEKVAGHPGAKGEAR